MPTNSFRSHNDWIALKLSKPWVVKYLIEPNFLCCDKHIIRYLKASDTMSTNSTS